MYFYESFSLINQILSINIAVNAIDNHFYRGELNFNSHNFLILLSYKNFSLIIIAHFVAHLRVTFIFQYWIFILKYDF